MNLRDEQLRKHALVKLQEPQTDTAEAQHVLVYPHKLASRMQAAKLCYEQLRSCGCKEMEREPWGARRALMQRVQLAGPLRLRRKTEALGRWLRAFLSTHKGDR